MLVLSRKEGEKIRIGNSIVVTLVRADRNKARIGIEAPAGVPVFRQELLDFEPRKRSLAAAASQRRAKHSKQPGGNSSDGFSPVRYLWQEMQV